MSNLSILLRLENKFDDYSQRKITNEEFTSYLINSIDALEAADYKDVQAARDFQYKFEVASFHDEDPEIENVEKVTESFKQWLHTLRQNYR